MNTEYSYPLSRFVGDEVRDEFSTSDALETGLLTIPCALIAVAAVGATLSYTLGYWTCGKNDPNVLRVIEQIEATFTLSPLFTTGGGGHNLSDTLLMNHIVYRYGLGMAISGWITMFATLISVPMCLVHITYPFVLNRRDGQSAAMMVDHLKGGSNVSDRHIKALLDHERIGPLFELALKTWHTTDKASMINALTNQSALALVSGKSWFSH